MQLASKYRLPAIYYRRVDGGLISYGPEVWTNIVTRQVMSIASSRARSRADLPVQAPTKYELVINLKSAKALSLEIPPTVLARADEVIE